MSLYIGNLSSRTRPDELEPVFRRFGRCTIQIKEKYGFVVYEYPASAERALKTLKGTRICGQSINLSWSKQQPTSAPRRFFVGGNKVYEPLRRRHARDNAERRPGITARCVDSKKLDGEIRKGLSPSIFEGESNSHRPYDLNPYVGESNCENIPQEDRWEEQVVDPMNEKYVGNIIGFDRYEPHGDETKELDGCRHVSPPFSSPSVGAPRMFEKNIQCAKEPLTSRELRRSMGRGYSSKKRNRKDYLEGAKGQSPSLVCSEYTSSRSRPHSRTSRSLSGSSSPFKSRSLSGSSSPSKSRSSHSQKVSESSSLRSSRFCHPGIKTIHSRWSKSKSHISSLLTLENNSKDYVENDVGAVYCEDLKISENITSAVENEFKTKSAKSGHEDDMEKDLSLTDDDDTEGERVLAMESDISVRSKMSSEEMCMVLKHYGLQCPGEMEKAFPGVTFFGSARLWPWEMIYYRRLKKGSISAENYSRRVAQNREFEIVDKYIRGSSAWGELI